MESFRKYAVVDYFLIGIISVIIIMKYNFDFAIING